MPLFGHHKMKEPVEGSAKVVNVNTIPQASSLRQKCVLDVIIQAPGMAAFVTSLTTRVNVDQWPHRDQVLPVLIDRADHERIEVVWDGIPTDDEKLQQARKQRLNQALAETAGAPASSPVAAPPAGPAGSAALVLETGLSAMVTVRQAQPLGFQNQQGFDMYALRLSVAIEGRDSYDAGVGNPVPPDGVALLVTGATLPAKVLDENPQAVVIDWAAALAR
jgi:hypothetical protein